MRNTLAALAIIAALTGCGADKPTRSTDRMDFPTSAAPLTSMPTTPPTVTPSPPPTAAVPDSEKDLPDSTNLVIGFGSLGPAKVGMTKSQALATGVFDTNNTAPTEGCPPPPLQWKKAYAGVDVLTDKNGTITSLGVTAPGATTKAGVGVGSTLEGLRDIYGGQASSPAKAGYGQSGVFVHQGSGWIGFLFNASASKVNGADLVKFIEVSKGSKPDLIRDGC